MIKEINIFTNSKYHFQQTYLVKSPISDRFIVIDPGDNFNLIDSFIEKYNLKIDAILLTHYHFDHVFDTQKLVDKYKIKVFIHEDDLDNLLIDPLSEKHNRKKVQIDPKNIITFNENVKPKFFSWIDIFHLPGHSQGSTAYKIKNNVFVGDVFFTKTIGYYQYLPGSSEIDMKKTIKKITKWPDIWHIYPGHGSHAFLEEIRKINSFIK